MGKLRMCLVTVIFLRKMPTGSYQAQWGHKKPCSHTLCHPSRFPSLTKCQPYLMSLVASPRLSLPSYSCCVCLYGTDKWSISIREMCTPKTLYCTVCADNPFVEDKAAALCTFCLWVSKHVGTFMCINYLHFPPGETECTGCGQMLSFSGTSVPFGGSYPHIAAGSYTHFTSRKYQMSTARFASGFKKLLKVVWS